MSEDSQPPQADLETRWRTLARPRGDRLAAERVALWPGGEVLVALDGTGRRLLLVQLLPHARPALPKAVRGLNLDVTDLDTARGGTGRYLVLSAADRAGTGPFLGLVVDLVSELPGAGTAEPAVPFAVIDRWVRFFGRISTGLTTDEQLGLIGELRLLLSWMPALDLTVLAGWQGPLGGRHDWVGGAGSVEVKVTGRSTGPIVHRISRLDQLDEPAGRRLLLLSMRASYAAAGSMSLDALIDQLRVRAAEISDNCWVLVDDRLRAVGVTLSDRGRYIDAFDLVDERLFEVTSAFPRLTTTSFSDGLPAGITDVEYALDVTACGAFEVTGDAARREILTLLGAGGKGDDALTRGNRGQP